MKLFCSESDEQKAVIEHCRLMAGQDPRYGRIYKIANESPAGAAWRIRMIAEGLRATVPDLCLPVPVGKFHGLYLEMKARGKKPGEAQLAEIGQLRLDGFAAEWCDNWRDAITIIDTYLKGELGI